MRIIKHNTMAINVTLGEAKTQTEKPFPKLMINEYGAVKLILDNGDSIQIVSKSGSAFKLFKRNEFDISGYTDYNEPITIQNA